MRKAIWSIWYQVLNWCLCTYTSSVVLSGVSIIWSALTDCLVPCTEFGHHWSVFDFDFTAVSATSGDSTPWIFYSGATHYMAFYHFILTYCFSISDSTYIYIVNSIPLAATQSGNITLTSDLSGRLTLSYLFCIPKITMQLLSVKITNYDCIVLFILTSCIVQDHINLKIRIGRKVNGLYQLKYIHHHIPQWVFQSPLIYDIISCVVYQALS